MRRSREISWLPFGDGLVDELGERCASDSTCLATFTNCAQTVLAERALPENTIACVMESFVTQTPPATTDTCQDGAGGGAVASGGAGSGGAGSGAGGGSSSSSSTGGGGQTCNAVDTNEPNDDISAVTDLGSADDCGPVTTPFEGWISGSDVDWGLVFVEDTFGCVLSPSATFDTFLDQQLELCSYFECINGNASVTCLDGSSATLDGMPGCCGHGGAVDFECNGAVDDDVVLWISVSHPDPNACSEYGVYYGF